MYLVKFLDNSAFEISNTASLSAEELELQFKKKEFIYIQKASLEYAEQKGQQQGEIMGKIRGEIKGKIEGKIEGKTEMALSLLKMGVDVGIISEASGLSVEEIQKLTE